MVRAAVLAALLTATTPAVAQSTAGFTLGEWEALSDRDRQVAVVAAIEGLLLVSSAPDADRSGVDGDCLSRQTLADLDAKLRSAAAVSRDGDFVSHLLEVSQCSRS